MIDKNKFIFVKTTDDETAEMLKQQGFTYMYKSNNTHVFMFSPSVLSDYSLNDKCYISNSLVL